jgi:iron complex outermembrane recepter protein
LDFQNQFRLGKSHDVVWGAGHRVMDAAFFDGRFDGFILDWDRPRRNMQWFSAFVQDEISLIEDTLDVTLGTKLEHNDFTGFEVQPTVRALWTPTEGQTFWTAISRAVRTPTLFEDQRAVTQAPTTSPSGVVRFQRIVSNANLEAENVLAYEAGYRIQPTDVLNVDAAVFYNVYDELKLFATQTTTTAGAPSGTSFQVLTHENLLQANTYGLELGVRWQPLDSWQLRAAYSFLKMDLEADATVSSANRAMAEAAERQSPKHQVYVQSSLDLPYNVEVEATGRYVDELLGFQRSVDAYYSLDVRFAWKSERLMLEVVGQNLLEAHHRENGGSVLVAPLHEVERGVFGRATFSW